MALALASATFACSGVHSFACQAFLVSPEGEQVPLTLVGSLWQPQDATSPASSFDVVDASSSQAAMTCEDSVGTHLVGGVTIQFPNIQVVCTCGTSTDHRAPGPTAPSGIRRR